MTLVTPSATSGADPEAAYLSREPDQELHLVEDPMGSVVEQPVVDRPAEAAGTKTAVQGTTDQHVNSAQHDRVALRVEAPGIPGILAATHGHVQRHHVGKAQLVEPASDVGLDLLN